MNFDKELNRVGTNSYKWDFVDKLYGEKGLLPMWVADSDFEAPREVVDALIRRASHGAYGYTMRPKAFYDSFINWVKKKYNWEIKKKDIIYTPGVVAGINWAVNAFTDEGDKIIVQSPVYYPFFDAVKNNKRELVDNTLLLKDGKYVMDFEGLIEQIDEKTKMIIFCSPHNPVTRVWKKEELKRLGEICTKHNVLILSDEIHSDLVFEGNVHIPMAMISPEIAQKTITFMAPSKTFNVAGLEASVAVITNPELKEKFVDFQTRIGAGMSNIFGVEAFIACYEHGEDWMHEQLKYVKSNVEFVKDFVDKNMSELKVIDPEGTYLLWVDCSALKFNDDELYDFLVKKVKLAVNMGSKFGKESGKNYIRLNLATQQSVIERALNSFKKQYDIRMSEL